MKSKAPQQKKESFTASECSRLIAELPQDRMGWTIRLMIATGLRPQEVMGLEPRHITEDGAYVMVEQAMKRIKGTAEIGSTKNASSYRVVPVPEVVRPQPLHFETQTMLLIIDYLERIQDRRLEDSGSTTVPPTTSD